MSYTHVIDTCSKRLHIHHTRLPIHTHSMHTHTHTHTPKMSLNFTLPIFYICDRFESRVLTLDTCVRMFVGVCVCERVCVCVCLWVWMCGSVCINISFANLEQGVSPGAAFSDPPNMCMQAR